MLLKIRDVASEVVSTAQVNEPDEGGVLGFLNAMTRLSWDGCSTSRLVRCSCSTYASVMPPETTVAAEVMVVVVFEHGDLGIFNCRWLRGNMSQEGEIVECRCQ